MTQNWWDIAVLALIGLGTVAVVARHLLRLFGRSPAGGCCGCSKGCGSDGSAVSAKPETPC
nr:hypothetical protein MTCCP1_00064 [uncultured bacterium]